LYASPGGGDIDLANVLKDGLFGDRPSGGSRGTPVALPKASARVGSLRVGPASRTAGPL